MRQTTRTSIALTGMLSILAETSVSIEPLFALAYRRHAFGAYTCAYSGRIEFAVPAISVAARLLF